jgi:hypothetical protein
MKEIILRIQDEEGEIISTVSKIDNKFKFEGERLLQECENVTLAQIMAFDYTIAYQDYKIGRVN